MHGSRWYFARDGSCLLSALVGAFVTLNTHSCRNFLKDHKHRLDRPPSEYLLARGTGVGKERIMQFFSVESWRASWLARQSEHQRMKHKCLTFFVVCILNQGDNSLRHPQEKPHRFEGQQWQVCSHECTSSDILVFALRRILRAIAVAQSCSLG